MAKIDSTAVNELIDLVQAGKPIEDRAGDGELELVRPAPCSAAPRMTSTVPPMRAAGEVAPLPRRRAPNGTEGGLSTTPPPPPVRMMTAPPSRANTIPPLAPKGTPAPTLIGRAVPPPRPSSRASLPPPVRTSAPATMPTAAPFETRPSRPDAGTGAPSMPWPEPRPNDAHPFTAVPHAPVIAAGRAIDLPGDAVAADSWFEPSRAVDKVDDPWNGTSRVERRPRPRARATKLIAPAVALVFAGVLVGGFVAFDGEGGKKHAPAKPARVAAAAAPAPVAKAPTPAPVASASDVNAPAPAAPALAPVPAASTPAPAAPTPAPAAIAPGAPAVTPPAAPAIPSTAAVAQAPTAAKAAPAPAATAVPPAPAPVAAVVAPPAPAPAPTKASPPTPAVTTTTPTVHEVSTTRGVVKLVDVRIDSVPTGATVMLVDNGKTTFLGTTPVAASLDPSRAYDVILTLEGHPTQMAHVDPNRTQHLELALAGSAAKSKPAQVKVAAAPAPTAPAPAAPVRHRSASVAPAAPAPAPTPAPAARKAKPAATATAAGNGVLMISSKPPCEIVIDGAATGLTTPQRSIPLVTGPHKITLVNASQNIKKTFAVNVAADQPTKLIQDFLKK